MALKTRLSAAAVNAQARVLGELLNGGFLDVMTGVQPDLVIDDENTEQMRLARLQFASIAFAAPRDGVIAANPITKAVATQTGTPTWFRLRTKQGEAVLDGSAGKLDVNGTINVSRIEEGQVISVSSFTHTVRK